jgi:predicted enzyme related to lactoylglutathione lyase
LGGRVLAGPMEPGFGRIAVLSDSQGAHFAVFEGETDE